MNDIVKKIIQIAMAVWLRRWIAVAVAAVVAVLAGAWISFMSDRYEASAKVYVDTQTVLKPLMNGLAFQPDIDQQVSMLAKTLISRPNVERLVDTPSIWYGASRDKEIERLMKEIKIAPTANNLYVVSYRDVNPKRAKNVVQSLVNMFVNSGAGENRRDSEDARRFIDEQIRTYEVKLSESETRLKDFKLKNFGMVGSGKEDFFGRASTLSDEVAKLRLDLSAAEHSRDAFKRELSNEEPQLPIDPGQSTAPPTETATRLDAQKRQLDDLLRRYTEEHPDVVATRRTIAQLERQRQAEVAATRTTTHSAATSPVYQKIRVSLAESEANVASLRSQLAVQQSRLDEIRSKAGKMPETEAELAQLNRDYDILRKNYDQLVARRESASLGVKLDQSAQLADFKMIEPPRVDPKPVMPGRQLMAFLCLPVALLLGIGVVAGIGELRPTVNSTDELRAITERPVLGSISLVITPVARSALRKDYMRLAAVMGAMVAGHVAWTGWIISRSGF